ncbi:hypothetical protein GGI35DRAFT_478944 [Trichoderma velutinum]
MRSSKHIIRRPYVPGGLRLKDLKPGFQPLGLYAQNMGLIQKSRKFFSDVLQTNSDLENTAVKPRASSNEGARWRAPPLRGRAMRFSNIRGKKRKRESNDGGFYRRKSRLLKGGAIKIVTEEEMDRDDLRCRSVLHILYPELESLGIESIDWLGSFEAFTSEGPDDSQQSFGDQTSELSCTLDNLTIIDDDDTIMHTPYTSSEAYNDSEISWMESISEWGDMYCSRRRYSDSSIGVPLCIDVVMDALSTDSGRRSVPPQLDLEPSLTSQSVGCASPGHVPVVSEDALLKELEVEETETEEASANASVEVETEASWETEAETEVEAETEAGTEAELESNVGTDLEETGTVTTADEASVSEQVDEEMEETDMELSDGSASVEETGANLGPEETESGTETETADFSTEGEEAEINTGENEVDDIRGVEASEAIAEVTTMHIFEETTLDTIGTSIAADEPELSASTPESVSEMVAEETSPALEPTAPTGESTLKLAFPTANSPPNQVGNIADYGTEPCIRCQQIDMEVSRRIRAVRERLLEELLVIEQKLRPYCSGVCS